MGSVIIRKKSRQFFKPPEQGTGFPFDEEVEEEKEKTYSFKKKGTKR